MNDVAALEWLDREAAKGIGTNAAGVIKALLAEPRLPAEVSEETASKMADVFFDHVGTSRASMQAAVRWLYAHLTAPKTKTVWRVTADDGCAGSSKDFDTEGEAMEALQLHLRDEEWVTIQRREVKS